VNYAAMKYVAEQCRVQGAGRAILHAITYRADRQTGECYLSMRRLALEAGVSHATVKRVIPQLVEAGELAIVIAGSGRRATCYKVTMSPLEPDVVGSPRDNPQTVVGSSGNGSGLIGASVVGSPRAALYKELEGKNEGKNGSAEPAAPPSPSPSGDDSASEGQGLDPRELMAKAVLALDPDALRDSAGWNLSDRFQGAWLPDEDVAKWLRHVRGKVTA
jgi:hypothetical protein